MQDIDLPSDFLGQDANQEFRLSRYRRRAHQRCVHPGADGSPT